MTSGRTQRVAAYNVCLDDAGRLLVCRLTAVTDRAGYWTLPGGGIDFGEHPADAAGCSAHDVRDPAFGEVAAGEAGVVPHRGNPLGPDRLAERPVVLPSRVDEVGRSTG